MFQHFMDDILREYLDLIAVGILDDVIIFSNSLADHIPHVRSILEVLRQHRLYVRGDERNKTHLATRVSMFTKEKMEWER